MHHELLQVMAGMRNAEDCRIAAHRRTIREIREPRRRQVHVARKIWPLPLKRAAHRLAHLH
jgi:hypothetical protein